MLMSRTFETQVQIFNVCQTGVMKFKNFKYDAIEYSNSANCKIKKIYKRTVA